MNHRFFYVNMAQKCHDLHFYKITVKGPNINDVTRFWDNLDYLSLKAYVNSVVQKSWGREVINYIRTECEYRTVTSKDEQ